MLLYMYIHSHFNSIRSNCTCFQIPTATHQGTGMLWGSSLKYHFCILSVLKLQHYRGMVYNGDTDMACNFLGDQEFVESLGLKVSYTIPYHTIPYHTIPYHTIPYHTIPYHTIPYHTIPYHTIPYHTIPYHTIPYHTTPYHTIPCFCIFLF